jgi:hypothetical protein
MQHDAKQLLQCRLWHAACRCMVNVRSTCQDVAYTARSAQQSLTCAWPHHLQERAAVLDIIRDLKASGKKSMTVLLLGEQQAGLGLRHQPVTQAGTCATCASARLQGVGQMQVQVQMLHTAGSLATA